MSVRISRIVAAAAVALLPLFAAAQSDPDAVVHQHPLDPSATPGPAQRVVNVDCTKGDTIAHALQLPSEELTINIHGVCTENVLITRNNVTLAGTDPATDGIHGDPNPVLRASAVTVNGGIHNFIQKLSVTGGLYSGVWVLNGGRVFITDSNLSNNGIDGVTSVGGTAVVRNTTITGNHSRGVSAWAGGDVICNSCTISGSPIAGLADTAGRLVAQNSTFNGNWRGLYAEDSGFISAQGGSFSGSLLLSSKATAVLYGVTQTALGPTNFYMDVSSSLVADGGTVLLGPINIYQFANLTLQGGSTIQGDLQCRAAALAFCENPALVTGTIGASCGSTCKKP